MSKKDDFNSINTQLLGNRYTYIYMDLRIGKLGNQIQYSKYFNIFGLCVAHFLQNFNKKRLLLCILLPQAQSLKGTAFKRVKTGFLIKLFQYKLLNASIKCISLLHLLFIEYLLHLIAGLICPELMTKAFECN